MVQLMSKSAPAENRLSGTGKKASGTAAGLKKLFPSLKEGFAAVLAKAGLKAEKAEAGREKIPAAERSGEKKVPKKAGNGFERTEGSRLRTAEKENGKTKKKSEGLSGNETVLQFLEAKTGTLKTDPKKTEADRPTTSIVGGGKGRKDGSVQGADSARAGKNPPGSGLEAAEQPAKARLRKSEEPPAVKKDEKSLRDVRREKQKENSKEKDLRSERAEMKDGPVSILDEPKKELPRETPELRVSGKNGILEKLAEEARFSVDGRENREVSSQVLKQLREDGNQAVVRSARIILKDRDEGEIRLILKPEKLGEVRIRLHLQDHLIGGRILVENSSIREAFEQNLQDLAAAFRESGFELGNIDVAVGNGGEGRSDKEPPSFADGRKAAELERSVPRVETVQLYASNSVNLMA